jgi:phospholipid/cholesterol/gamma-HCH transport system substrate-binding protein
MRPARPRAPIARIAALVAIGGAVLLVAYLLFFDGGGGYRVKLEFLNAQQLVYGNLVERGGVQVGSVTKREITDDGRALIEIKLNEDQPKLREGTTAIIRQGSLSSVANRYIELHMPPEDKAGDDIPDGGTITAANTTTGVEIDQFFNTFDKPTRVALQGFYRGNYANYKGRGIQANKGWRYLNPSLAGSKTLFEELNKDTPVLENFLVNSSRFVTALADRQEELGPLVSNLNQTTRALANEKEALAEVLERFPDFMRQANTTYVNLRAALDDVDPLVNASKPVARKLRPYLAQLRPFANEAKPTIRDLSQILRRTGDFNDLTELNRTYPALAQIAVETRERNGEDRPGAFPQLAKALTDSAPIVAHGRPYTVDLVGWFDDFSTTGAYDALGSFSRVQTFVNALSVQLFGGVIPREQRGAALKQLLQTEEFKRCPGASEGPAPDQSNVWSAEEQRELDCLEEDRAVGPRQNQVNTP